MQIDYDPNVISYEDLLRYFWAGHVPTAGSSSRQYRAAVFYQDEAQRQAALQSLEQVAAENDGDITTAIEPLKTFYVAEDYHQKYYVRLSRRVGPELVAIYTDEEAFRDSTAVARANGILGGYVTLERANALIEGLGISDAAQTELLRNTR